MRNYLVLFALLSALPQAKALADFDSNLSICGGDHFFTTGHDSGTPEEFVDAVYNGDPKRVWFVFTGLCMNSPNFNVELTRASVAEAKIKTWNDIFTLTEIDQALLHHKDQIKWIARIKESYGLHGGFYITSEQLIKLKASGLVVGVEYNSRH